MNETYAALVRNDAWCSKLALHMKEVAVFASLVWNEDERNQLREAVDRFTETKGYDGDAQPVSSNDAKLMRELLAAVERYWTQDDERING